MASNGPDASFSALVFSLSTSAWVALGKVADPISGEIKQDLNNAKYTIDLIMMLREKTSGNLTDEENTFLQSILGELQGNYAEMVFGEGAKTPAPERDEGTETPSPDTSESGDTPSTDTNSKAKGE